MERSLDFTSPAENLEQGLQARLDEIGAVLQGKSESIHMLSREEKERLQAVSDYYETTSSTEPKAQGKIAFLESALGIRAKVYRS